MWIKFGLNKKAFSLLEILLASVIFVISVTGLFFTLTAVRIPVLNKESALTGAVFGKQVLEALYSRVSASTYYNNCSGQNPCPNFDLSLGVHQVPTASLPAGLIWPIGFAVLNSNVLTYTVSCADGSAAPCTDPDNTARKVDLNIISPSLP